MENVENELELAYAYVRRVIFFMEWVLTCHFCMFLLLYEILSVSTKRISNERDITRALLKKNGILRHCFNPQIE